MLSKLTILPSGRLRSTHHVIDFSSGTDFLTIDTLVDYYFFRPPPEETIQINKIGKTKVDITRPDRAGREFRLTVTNTAGETVVDNVELDERFHSISDLVHNEKYKITIEAFENGRLVQTYNEEIETIEKVRKVSNDKMIVMIFS